MQDITLSPIASLRHRHYASALIGTDSNSAAVDQLDFTRFPPSFRIARNYGGSNRSASGVRYRGAGTSYAGKTGATNKCKQAHRPKMFHAIRRGASVLKNSWPTIKDVNIIDKYSRMIFPISFLAFNAGYWIFFALE